jgi:hypothetical protein
VDTNSFVGTIPECIGSLSDLRQLFVFSNQLTGNVPSGIAQLRKLSGFGMENNNLVGNVPNDICAIKTLKDIWADCGGSVPEILCSCCSTCCPSPNCE